MIYKQNQRYSGTRAFPSATPCPTGNCQACRAVMGAGTEALGAFASIMRRQEVSAGDALWRGLADGEKLAVVAQGVVMAQRTLADGRRQVVAFRFPGDVIDGAAEADPHCRPVAVTPVVLCRAAGKALEGFRRAHPWAAERLAGLGGLEAARLADHLLVLGRLTAAERVSAFLLECLARSGKPTAEGTTFALPMTRDDIADYLGINVETVSRQLSLLKKSRLIRLPKPGRVVVPDVARLAATVPFTPAARGRNACPETPAAA